MAQGKQQHAFLIPGGCSTTFPFLSCVSCPSCSAVHETSSSPVSKAALSCLKEFGGLLVADFARARAIEPLPARRIDLDASSLLLCVPVIDSSKLRIPTALLAQHQKSYNGCTRRRPLVHGQQAAGPGLQHNRKRLPRPASDCTLKPHLVPQVYCAAVSGLPKLIIILRTGCCRFSVCRKVLRTREHCWP